MYGAYLHRAARCFNCWHSDLDSTTVAELHRGNLPYHRGRARADTSPHTQVTIPSVSARIAV